MEFVEEIKIRSYDVLIDRAKVEDLQRRCEVGPKEHVLLYTDTMGDPICRIRNSPIYNMLVAELNNNEIVGLIQGSIKLVRLHKQSKVGYILGLRVSPLHRRKGIGSMLVNHLEQWFVSNNVDLSYMATEKDNEASINLFVNKHGYIKFRSPSILVHPGNNRLNKPSSNIEIMKLDVCQAEFLYRKFMGLAEFFPQDIDKILRNRLSLGTWVAYYKNDGSLLDFDGGDDKFFGLDNGIIIPKSWAMLSVWNSGELFRLRVGKAPFSCLCYAKSSKIIHKVMPCFDVPKLPEFDDPFGFYFMYGVHKQGPSSGKLVTALCRFVHNLATQSQDFNKVVVTEVIGGCDQLKPHLIPHLNFLSCSEDWWCIKAMKNEEVKTVYELGNTSPTRALFVDPREV
ncbi:hypothetical protein Leryth_002758 [Lithospermum erythrorhizon]|nr:hypothetical protein Leryth_002758 [Lithospermum erythrorhizon]